MRNRVLNNFAAWLFFLICMHDCWHISDEKGARLAASPLSVDAGRAGADDITVVTLTATVRDIGGACHLGPAAKNCAD